MKKRPAADAPAPAAPAARAPAPAAVAAAVIDTDAWTARVRAAAGDDAALLALATQAPTVALKLAAVGAIQGEATLKRAVRDLRDADKRVFREARRRHEALVAQREAREQAAKLIESATALAGAETIAANRLVELERGWAAVDASLLEPEARERFAALSAQLSALVRARGERQQAIERWNAAAGALQARVTEARAAPDGEALRALTVEIEAQIIAAPVDLPEPRRQALSDALAGAQGVLAGIEARQAAQVAQAEADAQSAEAAQSADAASADDAAARRARQAERRAERDMSRQEASSALKAALDQAEAALAEGHLADALKRLDARDLVGWADRVDPPLKARLHAAQAEAARLKGWQHWGGGRAREDLVAEAEALAAQLVVVEGAAPIKLALKPHAAAIESLRRRWKEIDRLGGASNQPLWLRFDAALTAAYVPIAAQVAEQKAQREQNLAQRQGLLDALEAVAIDEAAPDWKALARTLDQFQADWRKLGPAEHTVPHTARAALAARERAAIERLEAPLQGARRAAQAEREALVAHAEAIAAEAAAGGARDTILRVRDLQGAWQQHAKSLPLARGVEGALWARFKAATDAVFAERDAAAQARDAQFAQQASEREALIDRLTALGLDTPPAELKRTLAEVDREWRQSAPPPRHVAGNLESRFGAAFDAARQLLHSRAEREWQAGCDALAARVALGDALEDALPTADADALARLEADWSAAPAVSPAWDRALTQRWTRLRAAAGGTLAPDDGADVLLLKLESALDLPSAPEWQSARRELKLQAMKAALEGRSAGAAMPDASALLAQALAAAPVTIAQRQRRDAVIAALRARRAI